MTGYSEQSAQQVDLAALSPKQRSAWLDIYMTGYKAGLAQGREDQETEWQERHREAYRVVQGLARLPENAHHFRMDPLPSVPWPQETGYYEGPLWEPGDVTFVPDPVVVEPDESERYDRPPVTQGELAVMARSMGLDEA